MIQIILIITFIICPNLLNAQNLGKYPNEIQLIKYLLIICKIKN